MDDKADESSIDRTARRGIYLLPNLLTTGGLFAGFYAVVAAMRGHFDNAAIAVFLALVMDGLDGRVARLTNTQSDFGAEYDSIADIVSFGVAPSLVAYSWGLYSLGKPGWLVAFCFAAATALRLARFNIQTETVCRYFQGLPCPAAAALVASMVWTAHDYGVPGHKLCVIAAVIIFISSALMVSNIRYYSFKEVDLKGKVPFFGALVALLILVFISIDPPQNLFFCFSLYVLSGPVVAIWRWCKARKKRRTDKLKKKEKKEHD